MKVTSVKITPLKVPLAREYESGGRAVRGYWHILAQIETDEGVSGFGFTAYQQVNLIPAIASAAAEIGKTLVGMNVLDVEAAWEKMIGTGEWFTPGGLVHFAVAPLDIAMWDAAGKSVGQPIFRLMGGYRDRIPAYASDGFTYNLTIDELVTNAKARVADGFNALKVRLLGKGAKPEAELERVLAIKDAVGPDVRIMLECAARFEVGQALTTGRALQATGAHWFEDPVFHKNFSDLAHIASRLDIPLATGEKLFELREFARLFEMRAAGIAIIDLGNIGGLTPWRKVAALAHAYSIPVCGHVLPEIHIHALTAIPNGYMLEYTPRSTAILQSSPKMENGCMVAPDGPGLGLALDEDAVERYTLR